MVTLESIKNGVKVYGYKNAHSGAFTWSENEAASATHTATIINIAEIKEPDTAESLLTEFIKTLNANAIRLGCVYVFDDILARAKNVLDKPYKTQITGEDC